MVNRTHWCRRELAKKINCMAAYNSESILTNFAKLIRIAKEIKSKDLLLLLFNVLVRDSMCGCIMHITIVKDSL